MKYRENRRTGDKISEIQPNSINSFFKQGLFKGDAEKYIGKLINVDIGVVDEGDNPGEKT